MTITELVCGVMDRLWLVAILFTIICYVTGVIAGFIAAWWMGVICLFPIAGLWNGLICIGTWGNVNVALKLVQWITS
jgi:ABC-type multidrug transport system permease subunit